MRAFSDSSGRQLRSFFYKARCVLLKLSHKMDRFDSYQQNVIGVLGKLFGSQHPEGEATLDEILGAYVLETNWTGKGKGKRGSR